MDEALLFQKLDSIDSRIRSIQETYNNNNTVIMQALTRIEGWQDAHERADGVAQAAALRRDTIHDEEIAELAKALGEEVTKLDAKIEVVRGVLTEFNKIEQQAQGALKVWRVVLSIAAAALVFANVAHMWGGH